MGSESGRISPERWLTVRQHGPGSSRLCWWVSSSRPLWLFFFLVSRLLVQFFLLPQPCSFPLERKQLSTYLRNQNLVAGLHAGGDALAILIECAGADGEDLCLVELLNGAVGEEDASCSLGLGLDALDEDAVEEGRDAADRLDGRLAFSVSMC